MEIEEDIWHKLLILALNYDIVQYVRLANKARIELHNTQVETKISLHKAVCCHAIKIIRFYGEIFSQLELAQMALQPDFQGMNALEYSKLTEN